MINSSRITHREVTITRESHPMRFTKFSDNVYSINISCVFENGSPIYWTCESESEDGQFQGMIDINSIIVEDIYQNSRFEY